MTSNDRSARALHETETIAAIITPPGQGGVAAVRIAGPNSRKIIGSLFSPHHPSDTSEATPFLLRLGDFKSPAGAFIDEVQVTWMPESRSYTGLEQVEIFCHGGRRVVQDILEAVLLSGARAAQPGEFTRLAFLSGRIDLTQADGVAELIAAQTESSARAAREHLTGAYREHVEAIREHLVQVLAELEAGLDFPEEGLAPSDLAKVSDRFSEVSSKLSTLIASYRTGRILNEGFTIVIAGRPNAGKSSLFNSLLRQERALVNPAPGTTRDYLVEWLDFDGVPVRLIDTAGLRQAGGAIERAGQDLARQLLEEADLILWMVDVSKKSWRTVLERDLKQLGKLPGRVIANKIDLANEGVLGQEVIPISCTTGIGLAELDEQIKMEIHQRMGDLTAGGIVTSARHQQNFQSALDAIQRASVVLTHEVSSELVVFEVHQAVNFLDEITGRVYTEQILDAVFGRFCIGK